AIILAAGKGVRMKSKTNKIFLRLGGKEVIYYCLQTFQKHPKIDKIIIVTAKENIEKIEKFLNKNSFSKVEAIVEGGKERQFSAHNGLKFIKQFLNCETSFPLLRGKIKGGFKSPLTPLCERGGYMDIVLFHNASNPFVASKDIDKLIDAAKKYGASVVGAPVKDTIKKADKNQMIIKTIPRHNLWAMQTPQVIKFSLAWEAFNKAEKEKFLGTDDVSLVERLGKKVKIIPCSEKNFKITTRNDLKKARECV
ncbi:MAG: IspD/TarI family cytidylyltransferase, partial [bacterium]